MALPKIRIGRRIAEVIAATGRTQKDFAERIGLTPNYLSELVRELKTPGSEVLYAIRETFGVSADWMLTGRGSMFASEQAIEIEILEDIAADLEIAYRANVLAEEAAVMLLSGRGAELPKEERDKFLSSVSDVLGRVLFAAKIYNDVASIRDEKERKRDIAGIILAWTCLRNSPALVKKVNARFDAMITTIVDGEGANGQPTNEPEPEEAKPQAVKRKGKPRKIKLPPTKS